MKLTTVLFLVVLVQQLQAQTFVQQNYTYPALSSTASVTFSKVQTAGNLNVVVVGWNDTVASITSVTDSLGNTYQVAVPTKRIGSGCAKGGLSEAIYYSSGIKAGSNTVKVTFSQTACDIDVRAVEYNGVSTLDSMIGNAGNSSVSNSGAINSSSSGLLIAANMVYTITSGPGPGFTKRVITPYGDILEDRVVVRGTYSGTAPLTSSGNWVMEAVLFKPSLPLPPDITISTYLSVPIASQVQFESVVNGTTNTGVTWAVTLGTISSTGVYIVPSVTKLTVITVTSTSKADTTKSSSTNLVINPGLTTTTGYVAVVAWKASTSSNIGSYNVYRSLTSGGPYIKIGNIGTDLTFIDAAVQSETVYYYTVTSVDSITGSESVYSNQASAFIP